MSLSRISTRILTALIAFNALVMITNPAQAAVVSLTLDTAYTGDQPDGYVDLIFSDEAVGLNAGEVKLTIASHLVNGEDIKTIGFNFNPGLGAGDGAAVTSLQFTAETKTGTIPTPTISLALNGLQGDLGPYGGFDVLMDFGGGSNASRFDGSDVLTYVLKSASLALNANMFDSATPNGFAAFAAIHIRDTDGTEGSGKITVGDDDDDDDDDDIPGVPAPAALPAGLALLGLATLRRRRGAA